MRSESPRNRKRNDPHGREVDTTPRCAAQVFLVRAQDMDNIINVEVASEFPGGLGYSYFPSAFVLEIGYKQVRGSASVDGVAAMLLSSRDAVRTGPIASSDGHESYQ